MENDLIGGFSNMQFGFVKGKSTVDFIRAIANTAKGELWNI